MQFWPSDPSTEFQLYRFVVEMPLAVANAEQYPPLGACAYLLHFAAILFACVGLGTAGPEGEDVGEVVEAWEVDVELGAGFLSVVPMQ